MTPSDLPERYASKIEPEPTSGCWLWIGSNNGNGYGRVSVDGRMIYAHRLVYELLVGPIPPTFELDHLCRNRICVSPWHLEAVTQQENIRRAGVTGVAAACAAQTHCKRGHPLSGANLYRSPASGRVCRICRTSYTKERWQMARQSIAAQPCPLCGKRVKYLVSHNKHVHDSGVSS